MSSRATPETALPTQAPLDVSIAEQPIQQDAIPHPWPAWQRAGFRLAFCYLGGYCLFSGNATVWNAIPFIGYWIQSAVARVFTLPAEYVAQNVLHVASPGDMLHLTGSGDTAINWLSALLLLMVSLVATGAWTVLDRKRPHYQTLSAWLRFLIRLTLGMGMVSYGISKVFPLQMPQPTISSLSEPLGMHSPMSVLWNFIGLNPWYESICGAAEFLAGVLILFRRTALAGALLSAFVVSNVLLYNLAFDVPVKLYSGHLLLLSCFVILPDVAALWRFFWRHEPAAPTGIWVPPAKRRWFRRATQIIEIAFALIVIAPSLYFGAVRWRQERAELAAPCALCSAWRVESASDEGSALRLPSPFSGAVSELIIDSPTLAVLRGPAYKPSYVPIKIDNAGETIQLLQGSKTLFAFTQRDPAHLLLRPIGDKAGKAETLEFVRTTPVGGYPLLRRGFHWVSEYPYQR